MRTKLIIIRHGITDWSVAKRYCGRRDIELNDIGKGQAAKLREALKNEKIDAVYTSTAKRAVEFAKMAFKEFTATAMIGLNEMDFGIFEGLTYGEIMRKYPEIYSKWIKDPRSVGIPGGESMKNFKKRLEASLKKIVRQNENKTAAIITHAGAIKAIISDILKIKDIWKIKLEWGGISIVELKEEAAEMLLLNDTSYLNSRKAING